MNHPNWHPIARYALNWDGGVSRVYRYDVCPVAAVTGGGRHAALAAQTELLQGMEGDLEIPDEL